MLLQVDAFRDEKPEDCRYGVISDRAFAARSPAASVNGSAADAARHITGSLHAHSPCGISTSTLLFFILPARANVMAGPMDIYEAVPQILPAAAPLAVRYMRLRNFSAVPCVSHFAVASLVFVRNNK